VFKRLLSHMAEEDRAFTSDYYERWKKADFPTAELAKKAKAAPATTATTETTVPAAVAPKAEGDA